MCRGPHLWFLPTATPGRGLASTAPALGLSLEWMHTQASGGHLAPSSFQPQHGGPGGDCARLTAAADALPG